MTATAALSFSDRKAWALGQGNPLWLWPEVAPLEWQAALLQIEEACAGVLTGNRGDALTGDAEAIGLAGYTSGTGPLLGWWIEEGLLPDSHDAVQDILRHQLHANTARMGKMLDRVQAIVRHLVDEAVSVTILKGAHTAQAYFPAPGCRPMSDIDLLVAPADAAKAEAVVEAAGYRLIARTALESSWRHEDSACYPLTATSLEANDPWTLDLHVSLDIAGPPGAVPARLSALRLTPAETLKQPALLLHLAAHAGSGFHNLTLLRLLEIVLVARADRACGALDWDEFLEAGRATASLAFAYPAVALASRLSPTDVPQSVVEQCEAQAPAAIRRLVGAMRPATAHRIYRPSIREHYAWTSGAGGWLRRLAADIVPEPGSVRKSAAVHAARARGLLRASSRR